MRFITVMCLAVVFSALAPIRAGAELQSVSVGGQIRIRGNYWHNSFNTRSKPALVGNNIRWQGEDLWGRAIGDPVGGQTIVSFFDWDSAGEDYSVIEQRTRLHVRADFTSRVAAFVEFDSFTVWGEDFRSRYLTGADKRTGRNDDINLHQAYLEINDAWGLPVRVRVGRQEIYLGKGWLTGDNEAYPEFSGLSFDAVRLTYARDAFTLDAFWSKLAERSNVEEDGDTDFSGIYGSYRASEALALDAYWLWVRDAQSFEDTTGNIIRDYAETVMGLDDYEVTNLHTFGLRAHGGWNGLDYDLEAAWQFGDASSAGYLFKPFAYGDNEARFDAWAAEMEVGYTFDIAWKPRAYLGAAYFQGEDNRDVSFWEWINPFTSLKRPESSISFNRLFSNTVHSYFIDEMGELSNFWMLKCGITASPLESLEAGVNLALFHVVEAFDLPLHIWYQGRRIPIVPELSFLTSTADKDIGWELGLWARYHYSEDLSVEAGWSHLFTGDALHDGNFNDLNGLAYNGGTNDSDADYFYLESTIRF